MIYKVKSRPAARRRSVPSGTRRRACRSGVQQAIPGVSVFRSSAATRRIGVRWLGRATTNSPEVLFRRRLRSPDPPEPDGGDDDDVHDRLGWVISVQKPEGGNGGSVQKQGR